MKLANLFLAAAAAVIPHMAMAQQQPNQPTCMTPDAVKQTATQAGQEPLAGGRIGDGTAFILYGAPPNTTKPDGKAAEGWGAFVVHNANMQGPVSLCLMAQGEKIEAHALPEQNEPSGSFAPSQFSAAPVCNTISRMNEVVQQFNLSHQFSAYVKSGDGVARTMEIYASTEGERKFSVFGTTPSQDQSCLILGGDQYRASQPGLVKFNNGAQNKAPTPHS